MRVAVIGGGFSGMLAAYLFKKEGIDVTVYEKQHTIGGHCRTLTSKGTYTELGTIFAFTKNIKQLLIDLKVDYTERFSYRSFVDENYNSVEHMFSEDIASLLEEMKRLKVILDEYEAYLNDVNYGFIPEGLMMPLSEFLEIHHLNTVCQVIAPHLSSYGFGNICNIQAYYAFKTFSVDIINSFIKGEKLLFINKGTSELIHQLSQNISDIRYALEVKNVEVIDDQVKVETTYGSDLFDKVLITTKLPRDVIKDDLYNQLMKKIDTNPYITCAYEVTNKNLATTYYKANLGKENKVQFFHASRQLGTTTLVAYAYGHVQKDLINGITKDLQNTGIDIDHLITVNQWYIFPHLKSHNLTQSFYKDIADRQKTSNICLIGSLVSKPSIANLYVSVKKSVNDIIEGSKMRL